MNEEVKIAFTVLLDGIEIPKRWLFAANTVI